MGFQIKNFTSNDDVNIIKSLGDFDVIEYRKDLSVNPYSAALAYYSSEMNVRKRQVIAKLNNKSVTLQAGAMQWMLGDISSTTGVKGVGDMFGKMLRGAVTKESAIKPQYSGNGILALEPTYKHLLLIDLDDWNNGIVVEDGMFLACDSEVQHRTVARSNASSALAGGEGMFNLGLSGTGIVVLESNVPEEELIEVVLDNDVLKVDGPLAVAWSQSLQFTVERSGKSLIGSAASGEGLVNVFRGSGRVLMSPVAVSKIVTGGLE